MSLDAGTTFRDEAHETFRNELATIKRDGRRRWLYVRQPSGSYYRARTVLSWFLLAFLLLAPFITFRGQPLVLLNLVERKFVLFGVMFWPQDFYLVVLLALCGLVTLAIATVTIGRVWCGWLCPQTVFLEMLFRKIEYLIEGSAEQQLRRDKLLAVGATRLNPTLVLPVIAKHIVFFVLSFGIANVFLAYIIGATALWTIVTDPPQQHAIGLLAITIFSLLFYGVFARFREQACTFACPYGRVLSALQDSRTVTVTYDWKRGEPRGRLSTHDPSRGDCVDCGQCVTVCPTGIDIRNGIQLECVNCTACIDACASVMRRIHKPAGLIRLTSAQAVAAGRSRWLTNRVAAYGGVWLVLVSTVASLIAMRSDLDVLILRQPGTLYVAAGSEDFANFYNVQVINRTNDTQTIEYRARVPAEGRVSLLGPINQAGGHALAEGRLLLTLPRTSLRGSSTPVTFEVLSNGHVVGAIESSFLGPATDAGQKGRQ